MTHNRLQVALAAIDKRIDPLAADESAMIVRAKIRGLMAGYDARWASVAWETIEVESEFHLPVINPATGSASRTFTQAGKKDGVVVWPASGKRLLLEHKTTSDDITDANAPYWRRLTIDSQVSHYMLAEWQSGQKLDGTLYDVIRKPTIRPKDITKADQKLLVTWGTYCGQLVPQELRDQTRETPELFELRLIADTKERPDFYFGRRVVNRMDSEIAEFAGELWDVGQSILDARNNDRHYRNDASCMAYGTACEYLPICSGHDSIDSDKWQRSDRVHAELTVEGDGRSVLTHSRLKCFQTCRRKHFFRYEIGIKRRDEEDREALFFGSVFHEALAAWWSCSRRGNSYGDGNAAIEAAETTASGLGGGRENGRHESPEPIGATRG